MSDRAQRWALAGLALAGALIAAWSWLDAAPVAPGGGDAAARGSVATPAAHAAERAAPSRAGDVSGASATRHAASQPAALVAPPLTGRFGPSIPELGRSARLRVEVSRNGLPQSATLTLLAGPDEGLSATVDSAGFLELDALHPGLALLELVSADGARCVREVLLRHRRTAELELDFGDHGVLPGSVQGPGGEPLPGACVTLDGAQVFSDADGRFVLERRLAGEAEVVVRHLGFATQRAFVPANDAASDAASGAARPPLAITLQPAAELVIRVPPQAQFRGDVQLVIVPSGEPAAIGAPGLRASYPWSASAPLRVSVGGELRFDDLPRCRVDVLLFHPLARGRPLSGWCRPGVAAVLEVELEPAPTFEVSVLRDGVPVPRAQVELVVANRASERVRALGMQRDALDRVPVGRLPHTLQARISDAHGRALLGLADETAYVRVSSADGSLRVVRRVTPGQHSLSVDLAHPEI
ncbi:MAG: hypothetical protein DHS20C15_27000 [Planctomycetota bacterium]|nr:MAG: hypothetical protein DHS20C15_27000 [Planctomycetota bacterium]